MTAEVVVANKLGVAMAADSAVTITTHAGAKTYNASNKLFTLSKFHPIGVMFYGNSEINTVPWELLVKTFRHRLGNDTRPKVEEYMISFLSFLDSTPIIAAKERSENLALLVHSFFGRVRSSFTSHFQTYAKQGIILDIASVMSAVIQRFSDRLTKLGPCVFTNPMSIADLAKYDPDINAIRDDVLKSIQLDDVLKKQLTELAKQHILSMDFSDYRSGLVMAGYGEDEHYPSVIALETDGFVNDQLKMQFVNQTSITSDRPAEIMAFAQHDMSSLFVEGVDPGYQREIMDAVHDLLEGLPDVAKTHFGLGGDPEADRKAVSLKAELLRLYGDFDTALRDYRSRKSIEPLTEAVRFLDKADAASFAESLVSLTALKRRISLDVETVGGPIDVAFISKNDGFVWIQRKHYFKPEYNPFFLRKYLSS